jgi:hypothetical protein
LDARSALVEHAGCLRGSTEQRLGERGGEAERPYGHVLRMDGFVGVDLLPYLRGAYVQF